jgi:hypothetical protein
MMKLDPVTKDVVQNKIHAKQLQTYDEAIQYIQRMHGNTKSITNDEMSNYTSRIQQVNETVAQFYFELEKLARMALPYETKQQLDKHLRKRFIMGIRNDNIRFQLMSLKDDPQLNGNRLVEKAIDLEDAAIRLNASKIPQLSYVNNIDVQESNMYEPDSEMCQINYVNANEIKPRFSSAPNTSTESYNKQPQINSQAPMQQFHYNTSQQSHQQQNINSQSYKLKKCYACYQIGHKEYECEDDEAVKRYKIRQAQKLDERRREFLSQTSQRTQPTLDSQAKQQNFNQTTNLNNINSNDQMPPLVDNVNINTSQQH